MQINERSQREQTFRMTVLLVQLPQLLFFLFGPRWPLFLSGAMRVRGNALQFLFLKYCCEIVKKKTEKHQPVFAVAFGHLTDSSHIFPEQ